MRRQQEHVQLEDALTLRSTLGSVEFAYTDNRAKHGHANGDAGPHVLLTGSRTPYSYYFAPRPQQTHRRAAVPSSPREARAHPARLKKRSTMTDDLRLRPPKEQILRPLTLVEESEVPQFLHRQLSKSASSSSTASASTTSVLLPNLNGNSIWLNRKTQPALKPTSPKIDLEIMRHSSASGSSSATLIQPPTPSLLPPRPPTPPPGAERPLSPSPSTSTSLHYHDKVSMNPKRPRPRPVSVATSMSMYSQMSCPHSLQRPARSIRPEELKDWPNVGDDGLDQQSIQTLATAGKGTVERRQAPLTIVNQRSITSVNTASTQRVESPKPKASRGQRQRPRQHASIRSVSGSDTSTLPGWAEHITEVQEEMRSFLDMSTDESHSSQWWSSTPATPTTLVHSPPPTATSQRQGFGRCDDDKDSGILPRSHRSNSPSPAPTLAYIVIEREERPQQQEPPPPSATLASTPKTHSKRKTEVAYKPGYPRPSFSTSISKGTFDSNGICTDYDYSFAVDVLVYSNSPAAHPASPGRSSSPPVAGTSADSMQMRTEEVGSIQRRSSKRSSTKSSKRKMRLRRKWTLGSPGSGTSRTRSNTKKSGINTGNFRSDGKEKKSLFFQVANFFGRV
ncbi:hypothetical protein GALMADRAFT_810874 [Galerina marginata CBS 339.88]|uniref:Uncharacterized protein n=1 Tax=Galerina marginata (strain CBS 339.88) TaxID=685588 RepID=A0A067SIT1_GALM3|nr:hypothetical protein GALMADRAFT_810874 [Galerina marginata CBS 339.88]